MNELGLAIMNKRPAFIVRKMAKKLQQLFWRQPRTHIAIVSSV
jgi:hypothetical protein